MAGLTGRRIVLGVTGGIAAYKAVEVCRRLVDLGAHVVPIMTRDATRFVGETTFSALASEPVHTSLWDDSDPIPHTRIGQAADLVVVVPATARFLAAYTAGLSGDLLTAVVIATRAPVIVCPAMHTEMWEHASVQENIATLRRRGVRVVEPESGRLAGGDMGSGRLASPEAIVERVQQVLSPQDMTGLRVLVTAGGTREPIDAVRVIANRSSGKQGHALAFEAAARGASVTVVTTVPRAVPSGAEVVSVETAAEMEEAVMARAASTDVVVMAAAVADFRPKAAVAHKIKKDGGPPEIILEPTPDILAALGAAKHPGQTLVGFAAETEALRENAEGKLRRKHLDLIVANDVSAPGAGFEHDTNEVVILGEGIEQNVSLTDKRVVASAVFDAVMAIRARPTSGATL